MRIIYLSLIDRISIPLEMVRIFARSLHYSVHIAYIKYIIIQWYITEAIDSSDNEELQKLSAMLTEMVGLLRQGDGVLDPNTELAESKWLQWTPLMCAVAFNDTRTAKYATRSLQNILFQLPTNW